MQTVLLSVTTQSRAHCSAQGKTHERRHWQETEYSAGCRCYWLLSLH
jgi:hypothetical protein